MIAYLEELMAKLFGARDEIAIPVRAEQDETAQQKQLKRRK